MTRSPLALFALPLLAANAQSTQDNKQLVRDYLKIVQDPGFSAWDRYFAETIRFNGSPMPPHALARILEHFRRSFPDLEFQLLGQIAEGDRVATWGFFTGTHKAAFQGVPPTHQRVKWFATAVDRVEEGKVVELWHEMDVWGLVEKLKATHQ